MKRHSIAIAALLTLGAIQTNAQAQDGGDSALRISGFGTGALTWADTDDAQFARPNQHAGAGKSPRTGVDSNLGLQADYRINDWLSFTGQGMVSKAGEDDYGADLTWAFAKAKVSESTSVRVGRVGLPVFMISDYRHVGYANTMLRPAQEVYGQIPTSFVDGADVSWQKSVGGGDFTAQLAIGRTKEGPAVLTGHKALNLVYEHGPVTLRFGQAAGTLHLTIPVPLPDGRMTTISLPEQKVSFTSGGMLLDWNNLVLQTEVAKTHNGHVARSWYTMVGYRFGKLLPFYNHGSATGQFAQSTDSVGLRWDAFRSADIKVQVDRVTPQDKGFLVNAKPGFRGPVTVGAVAVDFIF